MSDTGEADAPYGPPIPDATPPGDEGRWRRLDWRLIVIGPLRTLGQFAIPILLSLIGVGTQAGFWTFLILPVALFFAFAVGALPWWTTFYRESADHLEMRTGLLHRSRQTAPRDRVRSVDINTPILHRILGVAKVEIGTGVDSSRIVLEVVTRAEADRVRAEFLARRPSPGPDAVEALPDRSGPGDGSHHGATAEAPGGSTGEPAAPGPEGTKDLATPTAARDHHGEPVEHELARVRWDWLRFAPLNLAQLAIVAGALGAASQFLDDLPIWNLRQVRSTGDWLAEQVLPVVLLSGAIMLVILWIVLSLVGYTLQWFGFRLVREPAQHEGETALRLTAGLLSTRSISVEERRIRGVRTVQPALMRLAHGGDLATLATGVEDGTTKVLPHCPVPVVLAVGNDVLGTPRDAGPLVAPLRPHGRFARRRAHVRWQWVTLILGAAAVAATVVFDGPWWAPVAGIVVLAGICAAGAESSYGNLGHALNRHPDGRPWHLIAGSGGFARIRTVLEVDGIIGWVVEQSLFQRRVGLVDLVATTAAGDEAVRVRDVSQPDGLALAAAATPGLIATFAE